MLKKFHIAPLEALAFLIILTLHLLGVILAFKAPDYFKNNYTVEDGLIEWLTVAGLLAGSAVSLYRFFNGRNRLKNSFFGLTTIGLAIMLFFVAGEEISWGQRIFDIEAGEYFQKHNLQGETNLHNLQIGEVKINKLVFSIILFSGVALYLIVIPLLYNYTSKGKALINQHGLLVPKLFHIAGFALFFILTELITEGKRAELMEFAGAFMFLLIVWFPKNKEAFRVEQ